MVGQYVELYPAISSPQGGSTESGARGMVREVRDADRGPSRTHSPCSPSS